MFSVCQKPDDSQLHLLQRMVTQLKQKSSIQDTVREHAHTTVHNPLNCISLNCVSSLFELSVALNACLIAHRFIK